MGVLVIIFIGNIFNYLFTIESTFELVEDDMILVSKHKNP